MTPPQLKLLPVEGIAMGSGPNQTYTRGTNGTATKVKDERGLYKMGIVASFCTLAVAILMATGGFFVWALRQESRVTSVEKGLEQEHATNAKQDADKNREDDKAEAWRVRMEKKLDDFIQSQQRKR
jgi:uncharacterized protein YlxW (UPF0749 family)